MSISVRILRQAIDLYLQVAYPAAPAPPAATAILHALKALPPDSPVQPDLLEKDPTRPVYAVRLGQPMYPHMKLVLDPTPGPAGTPLELLRVDTHDLHLHAAPGTPDADWLASIRASNKEITERIETLWAQNGLPTFKEFLRQQLEARRNAPRA